MKTSAFTTALRSLLPVLLALASPARALVIPGPNGVANNSRESLDAWTSANAKPAFSYWDNVIRVSDASGVYLGGNGSHGWVLTAAHVTPLANGSGTINITGTDYTVHESKQIGSQDMRIYRIGGEAGDAALPSLQNLPIASTAPSVGTLTLDFGAGARVEGTSGLATDTDVSNAPGVQSSYFEWAGAGALRWGTNTTSDTTALKGGFSFVPQATTSVSLNSSIKSTQVFISTFDAPGTESNLLSNEAGLSVGDSGGPVFSLQSGSWQLAGINAYMFSSSKNNGATGFGDYSAYVNLASYRSGISAVMVPEPTVAGLLISLGVLFGLRRRRA